MSSTNAATGLALNPFTPMAFLPPEIARQYTVFMYVVAGTTSVLVWDVICHLKDDYRLLTKHRINFSMIVYFVARLFNVVYIIAFAVVNTAPIGNCEIVSRVINCLFAIALPASELIFFLHVRAVYINNRVAVWLFTVLWMCTIATSLTLIPSAASSPIAVTKYCLNHSPSSLYATMIAVVPLINDSVLFSALVLRIVRSSYQERTFRGDIRAMIFGYHVPIVSRALLQNGQAYFLSTVSFNIATVVMYSIDGLPEVYRALLGFPGIAMMNMMASRIYRNTKLGRFSSGATLTAQTARPSSLVFAQKESTVRAEVAVVTTVTRDTTARSSTVCTPDENV